MDIVKRLQLNRNPKDIKSGSIVGAKNIMLDPISSSIVNEYGFKKEYSHTENIKGVISLNDGICVFCSDTKGTGTINLYRESSHKSLTNYWKWEGGDKVIGTYSYNYKGELILAVSEIFNNPEDHKEELIPLKTINFDKKQVINLEAPLPGFIPSYNIQQSGSLVCGTYTFFIRYKLDENTYSKWVQLTDDIIIIDPVEKEKPVHHFESPTEHGGEYDVLSVDTSEFNSLFTNFDLKSNRNIVLNVNFSIIVDNVFYNKCQIGYIIKRDSDTLGRLLGEYDINKSTLLVVNFSDNYFIEEIEISDFLEDQYQFYNVGNLTNYNNRLYISNYSEYKKYSEEDLSNLLNSIIPQYKTISVHDGGNKYHYEETFSGECDYNRRIEDTTNIIKSDNPLNNLNNTGVWQLFRDTNIEDIFVTELYTACYNLKNAHINPLGDPRKRTLAGARLEISDNYHNKHITIYTYDNSSGQVNNVVRENITFNNNLEILKENNIYYLSYTNSSITTKIDLSNCCWRLYCWSLADAYSCNSKELYSLTGYPNVSSNYYYELSFEDKKIYSDFRKIGLDYNNNRTLIPGQLYNFYIHFVRDDLSATDGYRITCKDSNITSSLIYENFENNKWKYLKGIKINNNAYFYVPFVNYLSRDSDCNENTGVLVFPMFSVNKQYLQEKGFKGFFISYEKVEKTVLNIVPIGVHIDDTLKYIHYTNTELLYNSDSIVGNILETFTSLNNDVVSGNRTKNSVKDFINSVLPYDSKHVEISFERDVNIGNDIDYKDKVEHRNALCINKNSIYDSKVKTLYQLTPIAFIVNDSRPVVSTYGNNGYMYLPGFLNNEKVITYSQNLILSSVQSKVYDTEGDAISNYSIKAYTYSNYSQLPLNAFSIKQDYDRGAITINNQVYSNSVLSPTKLSDFLEIKPAYSSLPIKNYTNYQDSTLDTFNKTVYRSDVISDESLNNGFRHFNIENYKNILENKGNITNVVGVGLYLLVHTEYSLFVFDRNNQLSTNAQLQIPDAFDIDYKEIMPSSQGFGGLRNKDESIVSKHGYIWYDYLTYNIYLYDGKQIKSLSNDIYFLLKNAKPIKVRFAEDIKSNRLIICITLGNYNKITLSFNFDTNSFISLHDYIFDNSCSTAYECYLWKDDSKDIFIYDKNSIEYLGLKYSNSKYQCISYDGKICSYIDIIFNDLYETPKQLQSLSYILGRNNRFEYSDIFDNTFKLNYPNFIKDNEAEDNIDLYSGFRLLILTDLCCSGILDISRDDVINNINSNKPHWNHGVWDFNNFRNKINKDNIEAEHNDVTNEELALIETINYYDSETGENKLETIDLNELKAVYYNGNKYTDSDMRGVIVGKYFIFRFIFERTEKDKYNKFETLDCNITKI